MSPWSVLYEAPRLLTSEWGHHRIFAPEAYPAIRALREVAILAREAPVIARTVPICWRREQGRYRLVALMALREQATVLPPYGDLPMAVQAYPFVVPDEDMLSQRQIWVDSAIADRPTDVGAPLVMADGRLSNAARMRGEMAIQLAKGQNDTDDLCDDLAEEGLLEPWPLKFDVGHGETVDIDGLFVLKASRLQDPVWFTLVERHGIGAGMLVANHRLSLFRINWLLANARNAVRNKARGVEATS